MLLGPLSMKSWMVWCKTGDSRGGASTPNSQSPLITKLGTIMQHCPTYITEYPKYIPSHLQFPTMESHTMLYRYYFQSQGFTVAIFRWLQQELFVLLWSIKYLVRSPNPLGTVTVIFMTVGEPDFYTPSQFHQPTCFWKLLKWGGKLVYYTPSPCKIFTQPSTILSSVVWVSALYIESLKYHQELRLLIWYY